MGKHIIRWSYWLGAVFAVLASLARGLNALGQGTQNSKSKAGHPPCLFKSPALEERQGRGTPTSTTKPGPPVQTKLSGTAKKIARLKK
jgi:hypothetical protein